MKTRRKVYIIKSLNWYYNDEVTIPADAKVVTAYARREDAEAARTLLESEALSRGGEPSFQTTWDDDRINEWLRRFDVPRPPEYRGKPIWTDWRWQGESIERLGNRWEEFCEMFDVPWFYHVVETELEV
jgi:hypothetical protein